MVHVIIAVENLRIGGYQRLALDQAYYLSDKMIPSTLILLNPEPANLISFKETEEELIEEKKIKLETLSGGRMRDFFIVRGKLKKINTPILVISHSMRSTILFWFARIGIKQQVTINTTIHQLPVLSASFQRLKRFTYAQFTDNLFAYSGAVRLDWNDRYHGFGRKIALLRNGVYLGRLSLVSTSSESRSTSGNRLIFLGRTTSWKGLENYFNLFTSPIFASYSGLMMVANLSEFIKLRVSELGDERIKVIVGANLKDYSPGSGDIHVYPAQYGPSAKFIEPISLNCLEMAALGVSSLVTPTDVDTWPDLTEFQIFIACDWSNIQKIDTTILNKPTSFQDLDLVRDIVSIKWNIESHLSTVGVVLED